MCADTQPTCQSGAAPTLSWGCGGFIFALTGLIQCITTVPLFTNVIPHGHSGNIKTILHVTLKHSCIPLRSDPHASLLPQPSLLFIPHGHSPRTLCQPPITSITTSGSRAGPRSAPLAGVGDGGMKHTGRGVRATIVASLAWRNSKTVKPYENRVKTV